MNWQETKKKHTPLEYIWQASNVSFIAWIAVLRPTNYAKSRSSIFTALLWEWPSSQTVVNQKQWRTHLTEKWYGGICNIIKNSALKRKIAEHNIISVSKISIEKRPRLEILINLLHLIENIIRQGIIVNTFSLLWIANHPGMTARAFHAAFLVAILIVYLWLYLATLEDSGIKMICHEYTFLIDGKMQWVMKDATYWFE